MGMPKWTFKSGQGRLIVKDLSNENIKKIVIAPQIVVYKNIFKNSKNIIDLLSNDSNDSLFDSWRQWYNQGYRKDAKYNINDQISLNDSPRTSFEKKYLNEIALAVEFIRDDYFNQFEKNNGIWPSFIEDWSKLKSKQEMYYIDFFRYDVNSIVQEFNRDLMMEYHVDEFPVPNQIKPRRHVATINFYLNDEYSGGEICVYDSVSNKSYKYKPNPGDAVIMPSTEPFYHAVKFFENNDRYFLRAFIDYDITNDKEWSEQYSLDRSMAMSVTEKLEQEYIKNDKQIIKISIPEDLIEVENL